MAAIKALLYIAFLVHCHVMLCQSRPISKPISDANLFDVTKYGAVGDGVHDASEAFYVAWDAACSGYESPTLYVPEGQTFLLTASVTFYADNCDSKNMTVRIDGTLVAPEIPDDWGCTSPEDCDPWIEIRGMEGMQIHGSGTIDARGMQWWDNSTCKDCGTKPSTLVIRDSSHIRLSGLTILNSPSIHILLDNSSWVEIREVDILAPDNSNTHAIHIKHTEHVTIDNNFIGTGGDCIMMGDGSLHVSVNHLQCGSGHGISVGGLGKHGKYETVENVHVKNVTFRETTHGCRVQSWQGGDGYARNITFEHITIYDSSYPIFIDMSYCDQEICSDDSAVDITDITFKHFKGTPHGKVAVKIMCDESFPCDDIHMEDINLGFTGQGEPTSAVCSNVEASDRSGTIAPKIPCLDDDDDDQATRRINATTSGGN